MVVSTIHEERNYVHRYDHAANEVKARGNNEMPIQGGHNEPFVNITFIYQHLDGIDCGSFTVEGSF
jgi:hypothetical protein